MRSRVRSHAIHWQAYYISKKKVTEDSISTYLNNKGAHNIDNKSIIETLNQLQGKGLINQLSLLLTLNIFHTLF